jgi:hypothetical protein
MPNNISHFHVEADDLARARRFYERVFGWQFRPWGPPGFFMIQTGGNERPGIHGSLGQRPHPVTSDDLTGFECTISVDDVHAIAKAIEANGGVITLPFSVIEGVGEHIRFRDPEGNVLAAMRYFDPSLRG